MIKIELSQSVLLYLLHVCRKIFFFGLVNKYLYLLKQCNWRTCLLTTQSSGKFQNFKSFLLKECLNVNYHVMSKDNIIVFTERTANNKSTNQSTVKQKPLLNKLQLAQVGFLRTDFILLEIEISTRDFNSILDKTLWTI